jgi:acyl-CoA reductase-like NAD-dependent aldehyde dehydrogenase
MRARLPVLKTYKLFIGGAFPRSESGRSLIVQDSQAKTVAHLCNASRKDLRDAVEAARGVHEKWAGATAYNRGQVLYRAAEMMEGKADELAQAMTLSGEIKPAAARREVAESIDRVVYYAGWADKYAQVLGCNNPVAGPYYNFTIAQPSGVVGVIAPDANPLLGLLSLLLPVIVSGNTSVVLASEAHPVAACVLAEVFATSDLPGGVVNVLTGSRAELLKFFAAHREIDGIHAAVGTPEEVKTLRGGAAENVKRVVVRDFAGAAGGRVRWEEDSQQSPYWIEPFVEFKTIWHPSAT